MNTESDRNKHKLHIDAVILWVDGNDKSYQDKMKPYLHKRASWKNKNFRTRFHQVNEIELSVASIIKNATFIRNIFIITDHQFPEFLKQSITLNNSNHPKIRIIDHKEIFVGFEKFLPVFNCRAIETMMYRIPNLSENFIYFNDDFIILKKTIESDFFKQGLPVIRGKWTSFDENIWYKTLYQRIVKLMGKIAKNNTYGYKRGQQAIARVLGFSKYYRTNHTPTAMRKSAFVKFYHEHPNMVLRNVRHKFRNPEQYVVQSLGNHLEIKNNTCYLKNDFQLVYFGSYKKPMMWFKLKLFINHLNANKLFLNLQSLDLCSENKLKFIFDWLNKKIIKS